MEPRGVMANQIRHGAPIQKLAGQVLIEPLFSVLTSNLLTVLKNRNTKSKEMGVH